MLWYAWAAEIGRGREDAKLVACMHAYGKVAIRGVTQNPASLNFNLETSLAEPLACS